MKPNLSSSNCFGISAEMSTVTFVFFFASFWQIKPLETDLLALMNDRTISLKSLLTLQQGYLYKRTSSDKWQLRFFLLYQVSTNKLFISIRQMMQRQLSILILYPRRRTSCFITKRRRRPVHRA